VKMVVPHLPEIGVELGFDGQRIRKIVQSAGGLCNPIGSKKKTKNIEKKEAPHDAKLLQEQILKKTNTAIQRIGIICCLQKSTITMKYIITKIVLVWAALAAVVGISKKRENESLHDAIKFPDMGKTAVVEDFEIAAYHNQA